MVVILCSCVPVSGVSLTALVPSVETLRLLGGSCSMYQLRQVCPLYSPSSATTPATPLSVPIGSDHFCWKAGRRFCEGTAHAEASVDRGRFVCLGLRLAIFEVLPFIREGRDGGPMAELEDGCLGRGVWLMGKWYWLPGDCYWRGTRKEDTARSCRAC